MNLISCNNCGVILDKDKLKFPKNIVYENCDGVDLSKAIWDGNDYVPFVKCPACEGIICQTELDLWRNW